MEKNGLLSSLRGCKSVTLALTWPSQTRPSLTRLTLTCLSAALLSGCIESGVVSVQQGQAPAANEVPGEFEATIANDVVVSDEATAGSAATGDVAGDSAETAPGDETEVPEILRIMAVGDSITHGVAGAKSYRQPLIDLLKASGCEFEMVGSMTTNLPDTGFDSPHEAYAGHRTDAFLTGRQSSVGNNEGISASMMQFQPDLIPRVVVSTVVPYFRSTDPDDPVNVGLDAFSEALKAWFIQASHPRVYLVDIREGFTTDMLLPDLVHPGDTGDAFIAARFFQSFEENDFCG